MEEEKSKKGLYISIIIFLLLCLFGSCFFIYKRVYVEKVEDTEEKKEIEDDKIVYLDTTDYKYTLDVYKNKSSELCLNKDDDDCTEVAFSIKTETDGAKIIAFDDKKNYILYDDNGFKVYAVNLNKYQKTNSEKSYNGIDVIDIDNDKRYILLTSESGGMSFYVNTIYNDELKIIYNESIGNYDVSILDNNLYLKEGNKILKYNNDGNLLLTSNEYSDLKGSILNYAIYVDNGNLLMQNVDTKDIIEITKWNNDYKYIEFASGYYNKEDIKKANYEEGMYIVIETGTQKADVYHIDSNLKVSKFTIENYLSSGFDGTYSYNYKK